MSTANLTAASVAESFVYPGAELDAMSRAEAYYRWILTYFAPHLGNTILEVGAGTGTFSSFLLEIKPGAQFTLLEPAENVFPRLEGKFSGRNSIRLLRGTLEEHAASLFAQSAVLVNVLEHLKADEACLRTLYRILAPEGKILLFVPALPRIFGPLDEAFEHFRRYTKAGLGHALKAAGFQVELCRYFNFPGVLSWLVAGKLLRQRTLRASQVRFYDRWVVPWCSRLERYWEPPLGQSLIAIGRK